MASISSASTFTVGTPSTVKKKPTEKSKLAAKPQDPRGRCCYGGSAFFNALKAMTTRLVFLLHAIVVTWRASLVHSERIWYLGVAYASLVLETIIVLAVRKGQEWKWWVHYKVPWWRHQIFSVTGLLCGEFTGHRWISRTKASDADLWCFLWFVPEQTYKQLSKQWRRWWFEPPSCSLWRHCNVQTLETEMLSYWQIFITRYTGSCHFASVENFVKMANIFVILHYCHRNPGSWTGTWGHSENGLFVDMYDRFTENLMCLFTNRLYSLYKPTV